MEKLFLAGIMVEQLFNAFATAAFFEFVIFAILEMRLLLTVWRARRNGNQDPWAAQRELSVLYARFYGSLLAAILLTYQLRKYVKIALHCTALHSEAFSVSNSISYLHYSSASS